MKGDCILINGRAVSAIGDIVYTTWNAMRAGELTFTATDEVSVGDAVELYSDDNIVFRGRVFSVSQTENIFACVAYDLLRYLAGGDVFTFSDVTAAKLVLAISTLYDLPCGRIADTGYKIGEISDDHSALRLIGDAIEMTANAGFGDFVLFDDLGTLSLLPRSELSSDTVLRRADAVSYVTSVSIDGKYCNYVKLSQQIDGKVKFYIAEDVDEIARRGTVRYYDELSPSEYGQLSADNILHARAVPVITVECVMSADDGSIRGGSLVSAEVDGGDVVRLICTKCRRVYSRGGRTLALSLSSI